MQDGGAEAKQKMLDGRAKKCKTGPAKAKKNVRLASKKCKMVQQKNARWPSK
jgi:hypothetical protein